MEDQTYNQPSQSQPSPQYFANNQQILPNSTGVLVLGILSIVFCWCYGLIGVVLGIIALALSVKSKELYVNYPGQYTEGSYKNLQAGKICGLVGLIISSLYLILIICYFIFIGTMISGAPFDSYNY